MLCLLISLSACGQDSGEKTTTANGQAVARQKANQEISKTPATEIQPRQTTNTIRDWKTITESGVIRALKLQWEEEDSLPRSGSTSLFHIELFTRFAHKHHLKVEWIKVNSLEQMFDYLDQYKADVIPRHLTITENRAKRMHFTHPLMLDIEV